MKKRNGIPADRFLAALEAIGTLLVKEIGQVVNAGWSDALSAHFDIDLAALNDKNARFYRHFVPLRRNLVLVLAENYRRCFKLALAHPHQTEHDPHRWALAQLQPVIVEIGEWIRDWYILACDGAQPIASAKVVPGQTVSIPIPATVQPDSTSESWHAPAWLFQVSLAYFGIGALKTKHVPATNSEQKLSPAHTRLLLKGARRVFLWDLEAAIDNVRNEEMASAGTIPTSNMSTQESKESKKRKHWQKGTEGLGPKKQDYSKYMDNLTEKQQLAFSLRIEYRLGLAEVASRMGLDRKTAYEHIEAASKKIDEAGSADKRRRNQSKTTHE